MIYIFEPQKNISEIQDETQHMPCSASEAEIYAVFTAKTTQSELIYQGDLPARAFMTVLHGMTS